MAYRYDEYGDAYEYEDQSGMSKLLTGLLIGAAIGGVVMLFLAPESGKKTLARLRKRTKQLRKETMNTVDDTMHMARERFGRAAAGVRKQAKGLTNRSYDMLDEQRERVADIVETGRKRIRVPGR
jgi:gas vesicle protein